MSPFFLFLGGNIMPRLARKNLETPFVHVIVQGVNKEYIFNNDEYIEKYLSIINKNKVKYNFTIIAYCIMNNHAHFLVYTEDILDFGKFMHKCNLLYAQLYNKEKNRVGVLFRNRYQTEPIYNIKYLTNCIKYIHDNPVKANIAEKCEDYKYSSYCDYKFNSGVTQSEIMRKIFGRNCNYMKLFKESFNMRFIDTSYNESNSTNEYITEGIRAFKREKGKEMVEILLDREEFKCLISYLKNTCKIKYVEIENYFEISRGTMDALKKD